MRYKTVGPVSVSENVVLAGDWWLVRQHRIPLTQHRTDENQKKWHQLSSRRRPDSWATDVSLAEISEKAARFCFRLHSMQLAGVREALAQLGNVRHTGLTRSEQASLRSRMDVPAGKQWSERLKTSMNRWTLDFNYKLGILRGVQHPSPPLLDWAASMTWLTMGQAEVAGVTLPLHYLIYSCCAVCLCSKMKPLDAYTTDPNQRSVGDAIDVKKLTDLQAWQVAALGLAADYLTEPRSLLSDLDCRELAHLVKNEPSHFFAIASTASGRIQTQLSRWGVQS